MQEEINVCLHTTGHCQRKGKAFRNRPAGGTGALCLVMLRVETQTWWNYFDLTLVQTNATCVCVCVCVRARKYNKRSTNNTRRTE